MTRRWLICSLALFACDNSALLGSIEKLEEQERLGQQKLSAIQEEQRRASALLEQTRGEVREARCSADRYLLRAEKESAQTACAKEQTAWAECRSQVAKNAADNTIFGCLLGLGASMLTGGAALVATAGCLGGRALSEDTEVCPPPACDPSEEAAWEVAASVLVDHPLSGCSWLGVSVEDAPTLAIPVEKVTVGGELYRAGLRADDLLISFSGESVRDAASVAHAFHALSPGQTFELAVVRAARLRMLSGVRGGSAQGGAWLGDELEVSHGRVRVASVQPGAPDEVHMGDTILGIDGQRVYSARQVERMISLTPAGSSMRVELSRAGLVFTVVVTLTEPPAPDAT